MKKRHIFKNQACRHSYLLQSFIFQQHLVFLTSIYTGHISIDKGLFPDSISETRTKKCKKTAKRYKMTGSCTPFAKRNALHFHAKKKKDKETFYHEWSFCLDLNSGICYSIGTEHSFC